MWVSDCAVVADVNTGHHFAPDMAHAAAAAVKAGTDVECRFGKGQAHPALVDAVHRNLVSVAEIDAALRRLFTARFRLGMFDPPSSYAYGRIAVIGPTAELVQSLQDNYNGPLPSPVYPLNGIEKRFSSSRVSYAQGSSLVEGMAMPIEHTALRPRSATPATASPASTSTPRISADSPCSNAPTATLISTGTKLFPLLACSGTTTRFGGLAPSHRPLPATTNSVYA
jgi:beta-glucosidase